jgi:hypothetical protein
VSGGEAWDSGACIWIVGFGGKGEFGLRQDFGEIGIGKSDADFSLSEAEGEFNGIGQATLDRGGESDSVDDEFYRGLV